MRTRLELRLLFLALLTHACAGGPHEARAPQAEPAAPPPAEPRAAAPVRNADEQAELRARFDGRRPQSVMRGRASYYSDKLAGNPTASGEIYDPAAFTAAHRSLPFGTMLRVRLAGGGEPVYVRVNDRGPFAGHRRVLDLSRAAAERIGLVQAGVLEVEIDVLGRAE